MTCVILPTFPFAVAIDFAYLSGVLALEGFYAANDFHDLAGNLALARAVVIGRKLLDHFGGVLGGALHGDHPGDLLAHGGVEEALEELGLEARGHYFFENAFR